METWTSVFNNAASDQDSRLGTYLLINPTLSAPPYLSKIMFETDRQLLTRFRCGSHSLMVEKGRYFNVERHHRLCSCGIGVQNILHCFTECPLVLPFLHRRYTSLSDIFDDDNICLILHRVCKELGVAV